MIDLHTHSLFSDGALVPSELVRRAMMKGYEVIAITDHGDASNIDFIIPRVVTACRELSHRWKITALPGIELTHVPPETFAELTEKARSLGAVIVIGHGESPVEPVEQGSNRAAIEAGVDILAHPGLITKEDAALAKKKGVCLEITARKGHSLTNGHVARIAAEAGATMVLDTDGHAPDDLITRDFALTVLRGAGLSDGKAEEVLNNAKELAAKARERFKQQT